MLVMRESSSHGYEMLRNVPSYAGAAEIVYAHRERFDGTGYPRGLKGEAIPLGARIVGVADAFEMFISDRPHDLALGIAAARREVLHWSGRHFDPHVVDVFLERTRWPSRVCFSSNTLIRSTLYPSATTPCFCPCVARF